MLKTSIFLFILGGFALASGDSLVHSEFYQLVHFQPHLMKGDPIDTSRFIDALTVPPTLKVPATTKQITVEMSQFATRFYKSLPTTQTWGYNKTSPGPTIEVESGQALQVLWKNSLPTKHLLPADDAAMTGMSNPPRLPPGFDKVPDVRTVVHLHGAAIPETDLSDRFHNNDGWPDNWVVPGETQIASYPNQQTSRMLWYHDHAMDTTARNVNAGLVGMYIIRDAYERSLNLPSGKYEVPLMFQTHDFGDDAALVYPGKISAEVYGSTITVNGKIWPYLNVEPRKYRLRMVNAANARSLALQLVDVKDSSAGPAMNQIGSDSGFLAKPAVLDKLNLNPAERADLIVDFSKSVGHTFLLQNSNVGDDGDAEIYLPNVMIFKVATKATTVDKTQIPTQMKPIVKMNPTGTTPTRKIVINEVDTPNQPPVMMLNDKVWDDPIEDQVKLNSTEVWQVINALPDGHPFHVHLVQFQVLDRRTYDVQHFLNTKEIVYTGAGTGADQGKLPLDQGEQGWKDTTFVIPGTVTRIIAKFGPYTGKFVFHCHILEHEDMGMMRPFEVVP